MTERFVKHGFRLIVVEIWFTVCIIVLENPNLSIAQRLYFGDPQSTCFSSGKRPSGNVRGLQNQIDVFDGLPSVQQNGLSVGVRFAEALKFIRFKGRFGENDPLAIRQIIDLKGSVAKSFNMVYPDEVVLRCGAMIRALGTASLARLNRSLDRVSYEIGVRCVQTTPFRNAANPRIRRRLQRSSGAEDVVSPSLVSMELATSQ